MKAGIYDPYLDTLGGGERYCLTVAEILLTHGYDVDLFWSGDPNLIAKASDRFSLNLDKLNLVPDIFNLVPQKIEFIEDKESLYHSHHLQSNKTKLHQILDFKNKINVTGKYDLFFFLSDGSIPFLFSKKNILHVQVPFNLKRNHKTKILNALKKSRISNIICNSKFTKRFTDHSFNASSDVLYPPVDIQKFSFNSSSKENIILSVGRFDNILNAKKQDVLINAFAVLSQQNPSFNWKLILAGGSKDDPSQNQYLKHLQFLSRGLNVEFDINTPFAELQKIYSKSKIYWHAAGYAVDENLHPESTEHFGITVVEAMAAGLVPIVVAKGGLPEIVKNEQNGYLWNTTEELIAKSQLLIASPQSWKQLSQQAVIDSANYSKESFSDKFLSLIS